MEKKEFLQWDGMRDSEISGILLYIYTFYLIVNTLIFQGFLGKKRVKKGENQSQKERFFGKIGENVVKKCTKNGHF